MPDFNAAMAQDLVVGVILPALVALAIAWLSGRIWQSGLKHMYLPANVAFVGSFFLGFGLLHIAPWLPKGRDYEWLPVLALLAGSLAAVFRATNLPYVRWYAALPVALTVAWLVVPDFPKIQPDIWWWRLGFAAAIFWTWMALQLPSEQLGSPYLSGALAAVGFAASMVLFLAGFAMFAQLAALGAAVMAGLALAELIDRNMPMAPGLIPAFAVLHVGWLGCGLLRSDREAASSPFLLMILAPSCLGLAWLPRLRRVRWLGILGPMVLTVLVTLAAVWRAWLGHEPQEW